MFYFFKYFFSLFHREFFSLFGSEWHVTPALQCLYVKRERSVYLCVWGGNILWFFKDAFILNFENLCNKTGTFLWLVWVCAWLEWEFSLFFMFGKWCSTSITMWCRSQQEKIFGKKGETRCDFRPPSSLPLFSQRGLDVLIQVHPLKHFIWNIICAACESLFLFLLWIFVLPPSVL